MEDYVERRDTEEAKEPVLQNEKPNLHIDKDRKSV